MTRFKLTSHDLCPIIAYSLLIFNFFGALAVPLARIDEESSQEFDIGNNSIVVLPPRGCRYKGYAFKVGDEVPTEEPCLQCKCSSAVVCKLRICPEVPMPPPPGCIVVHKAGKCCSKLVCPENNRKATREQRLPEINLTSIALSQKNKGQGFCVLDGTVYAEGSAMRSSTLCEYCFCIRGEMKCSSPKCIIPQEGCKPKFRSHACCPTNYQCREVNSSPIIRSQELLSSTIIPDFLKGCRITGGGYVAEGEPVLPLSLGLLQDNSTDPCQTCFCMGGLVRCRPLECSRPIAGCSPVTAEGHCCPDRYICPDSPVEDNAIKSSRILFDENDLTTTEESTTTDIEIENYSTTQPSASPTEVTSSEERYTQIKTLPNYIAGSSREERRINKEASGNDDIVLLLNKSSEDELDSTPSTIVEVEETTSMIEHLATIFDDSLVSSDGVTEKLPVDIVEEITENQPNNLARDESEAIETTEKLILPEDLIEKQSSSEKVTQNNSEHTAKVSNDVFEKNENSSKSGVNQNIGRNVSTTLPPGQSQSTTENNQNANIATSTSTSSSISSSSTEFSTTTKKSSETTVSFIPFSLEDAVQPNLNDSRYQMVRNQNFGNQLLFDRDVMKSPPRGYVNVPLEIMRIPSAPEIYPLRSPPLTTSSSAGSMSSNSDGNVKIKPESEKWNVPVSASLYNNGFYKYGLYKNEEQKALEDEQNSKLLGLILDEYGSVGVDQLEQEARSKPKQNINIDEPLKSEEPSSRIYSKFGIQDSSHYPYTAPSAPSRDGENSSGLLGPGSATNHRNNYRFNNAVEQPTMKHPIHLQKPSLSYSPVIPFGGGPSGPNEDDEFYDEFFEVDVDPLHDLEPPQATSSTQKPETKKPISSNPPDIFRIGLKLSGCNIYGKMYGAGSVIVELSSPCIECKCTEIGVNCSEISC